MVLERIKSSVRKNKSEIRALVTGRMPSFVYGVKSFKDIPVFCFHSAKYPDFERQLVFLKRNGYLTLTADELYARLSDKNYRNTGKEIVLTFDDGMASVWSVAYPLLEKFEFKLVSFILPGLIEESTEVGPTIFDDSEPERPEVADRDYSDKPLCNWQEVRTMHASGLVDFQSHGLYHSLISVSNEIVDFIHPDFDVYHYGNIHLPVYQDERGEFTRKKVLGHPVYKSRPRLLGLPRYLDPLPIRQSCEAFVKDNGGEEFFKKSNWRDELLNIVDQSKNDCSLGRFETEDDVKKEIVLEMKTSKEIIEDKLKKTIYHFCFPWFSYSEISVSALEECHYRTAHIGSINKLGTDMSKSNTLLVPRVQEEYLLRLPGSGRNTLMQFFRKKSG